MKDCGNTRWELSAYLDGELTPPRRAEVETHLASCTRCQGELNEMKALVAGVAALPKLQPSPRFLVEVRHKIAGNEKTGAPSWPDYIFRPFWLKIPLEVAALIVVIGLVLRSEHPLPTQQVARLELAKSGNRRGDHANTILPKISARSESVKESDAAVADKASPMRTPDLTIVDDKKAFDDRLAVGGTAPAPSPNLDLIRSVEFPRSKPGGIVTVHARMFDDVRNQAQQLATRCNGRVVVVPASKGATERTLFVELPQEYVAAFTLELSKTAGAPAAPAKDESESEPDKMSGGAPSTGVLTGNAPTNNGVDGLATFGPRDEATAAAPETLLEIRVVGPAN